MSNPGAGLISANVTDEKECEVQPAAQAHQAVPYCPRALVHCALARVRQESSQIVRLLGCLQAQSEEILSSMSVSSLWERRLAYILTLGVIPLYRRNGLGVFHRSRASA